MKKCIFSLLALFGMNLAISAQSLSVADVEAVPGERVKATLVFECPADTYSGGIFSIQFPATGFTVNKDDALDWSETQAVGEMVDGKVKFSFASRKNFATTTEIDVYFTVDSSIDLSPKEVTVTDISLDHEGRLDKVEDATFTVNIVNAHLVTLSENATEAPKAATGVNVKVERTIAANAWSTICLPFAMTADQLAAAFPGGVELGDFTSWASEENDEGDIVGITVGFTSVSAIEANHPYIIKVKEAVSEFTVEGVDIAPEEELSIEVGKKRSEKGSFNGTYVAGETIPETDLFLNAGKFWYATSNTKTMKAFRGYFEFYDVLTEAEGAASRINITFDDVTAIKGIKTDGEEKIYTLSGQRVNKAGKGVYIVNGKKVIKK